jgi:hypothetical protein
LETWGASIRPHRHRRHRHRRHHRHRGRFRFPAPAYAPYAIPILVVLLLGWLVWVGAHSLLHFGRNSGSANALAQRAAPVPPWVQDFDNSLDTSARAAASGNLSAAEIAVDRAESFVTISRLESRSAPPDFFTSASSQLDRILQQSPGDQRLFEHITSARVELAALRSAQEIPPAELAGGKSVLYAPRPVAANQVLNPASLGNKYLDATPLPEFSEILLPPTTRALADGVRVEGLTLAGAAQTLDGIWWRDVTFVDTRLRYENGELSLQNVRFVHCRFGLPSDERGARIAGVIALTPPPGAITLEMSAAPSN